LQVVERTNPVVSGEDDGAAKLIVARLQRNKQLVHGTSPHDAAI
jgi:hypothetical protein